MDDVEKFLEECEKIECEYAVDKANAERLIRLVKRYREALREIINSSLDQDDIYIWALNARGTAANAYSYTGLESEESK